RRGPGRIGSQHVGRQRHVEAGTRRRSGDRRARLAVRRGQGSRTAAGGARGRRRFIALAGAGQRRRSAHQPARVRRQCLADRPRAARRDGPLTGPAPYLSHSSLSFSFSLSTSAIKRRVAGAWEKDERERRMRKRTGGGWASFPGWNFRWRIAPRGWSSALATGRVGVSPFAAMSNAYTSLIDHLKRAHRLGTIAGLLGCDEQVNLPPDSADQRAEQLALMAELHHAAATDPEIGRLLTELETANARLDADQRVVVARARLDYD